MELQEYRDTLLAGETGIVYLALGGVVLHIDLDTETQFADVSVGADQATINMVGALINDLGFEVMPDFECPPTPLSDGGMRYWLAQCHFPDTKAQVSAA